MNEQLLNFTSTGWKLLYHPDVIFHFKTTGKAQPISLQLGPTSECNLNCCFCSNANRTEHEALGIKDVADLLVALKAKGLKTVEWTGGGDPTMWGPINEGIQLAESLGLEQGFITNGLLLRNRLSKWSLKQLRWIRISMNCLDYVTEVELPEINGTLGFSYVWNERTNEDALSRLRYHVTKYAPCYVRVVPNCQATHEEQERNNVILGEKVASWGMPYFYQPKSFSAPRYCYWCYFKPFVLHDGYTYPCSSVVLNTTSDRTFHEKYRWVTMEKLPLVYERKATPIIATDCDHCVFKQQNEICSVIRFPTDMQNFV